MSGYVFVTRGDLTRLACDAFLLPSDSVAKVEGFWLPHLGPADHFSQSALRRLVPEGWTDERPRTVLLPANEHALGDVWLTNVGGYRGKPLPWYVAGAGAFLDAASERLENRTPRYGRSKPLLALPLVGSGAGAASDLGELVKQLLPELERAAVEHNVDVALVTHDAQTHDAVQAYRTQHFNPRDRLPNRLRGMLDELSDYALSGNLVLFLGAGVGVGAGLPTWDAFLSDLAKYAGFSDAELDSLPHVDRAAILARALEDENKSLIKWIRRRLGINGYSLIHSLLATLPTTEVVTTNYDNCFEFACEDVGRSAATLPYEPARAGERWVLKLHGSIDHDDIVLTRQQYLRYADRRSALAGIVQALLITRHMLFVGFSLDDDNFHRIIDDVCKAVRGDRREAERGVFGTALMLSDTTLLKKLWERELSCVAIGDSVDPAIASRELELFLDCLLAATATKRAHLLDTRFANLRNDEEIKLAGILEQLAVATPKDGGPLWDPILELLVRHGARDESRSRRDH